MNRVIISYGNDFFLNKTAKLIAKYYDVTLIQNFVPGLISGYLVKFVDFVFGKKIYPKLMSRKVSGTNLETHQCSFNDVYGLICRKLIRDNDKVSMLIAEQFGRLSCKWIRDANIFHVRSGFGQGGAIAMAKCQKMVVFVDHSIAYHMEMEKILKPEYDRHKIPFPLNSESKFWSLVIKDCEQADVVIVNSMYVKKTFLNYGFDPMKLEVVYLGVREDWFGRKVSYKLSNKQIHLLFVGSFSIRKGAEYVMQAAQLLREVGVDFRIIVIGDNSELKEDFQKYNMENFDFVGRVTYDQLVDYYTSSDAYLFPSLCEGSTRAGMEAMAVGLPVILTENCGCPVVDGVNGILVPIKDAQAIADAVEKLSCSQELREKLGKNAVHTISSNYTWNHYLENLHNVYQKYVAYE